MKENMKKAYQKEMWQHCHPDGLREFIEKGIE